MPVFASRVVSQWLRWAAIGLALFLLGGCALGGQPGNEELSTRTVKFDIEDGSFGDYSIPVQHGETVRFVIRNRTAQAHDFAIGSPDKQKQRRQWLQTMADAGLLGPDHYDSSEYEALNAVLVPPGATRELVWWFNRSSRLEFASNIPGHYERGKWGVFNFDGIGTDPRILREHRVLALAQSVYPVANPKRSGSEGWIEPVVTALPLDPEPVPVARVEPVSPAKGDEPDTAKVADQPVASEPALVPVEIAKLDDDAGTGEVREQRILALVHVAYPVANPKRPSRIRTPLNRIRTPEPVVRVLPQEEEPVPEFGLSNDWSTQDISNDSDEPAEMQNPAEPETMKLETATKVDQPIEAEKVVEPMEVEPMEIGKPDEEAATEPLRGAVEEEAPAPVENEPATLRVQEDAVENDTLKAAPIEELYHSADDARDETFTTAPIEDLPRPADDAQADDARDETLKAAPIEELALAADSDSAPDAIEPDAYEVPLPGGP